jgi:NAD dependent epimerase/dehydratase
MSRRILVTGAGGFIGSHLVEMLLEENYEVTAMFKYSSSNSMGNLENSKIVGNCEIIFGDIRDGGMVNQLVKGKDIIINLAALIGIPYSYIAPNSYVETNVIGTQNLLNASVKRDIVKFIQLSTSEVYGTAQYSPIDEKHPMTAQSPYSASKIASDSLSLSYYNAFELPVVIARPFNTYGPRQSNRAVIPTIISQIESGHNEIVLGNTHTIRDLNYVKDTTKNLIAVLKSKAGIGESINIGGSGAYSISEIVNKLMEITGKDLRIKLSEERIRPEKSEVEKLTCDNSKFKKLFGEFHCRTIDVGLNETLEWFKQNNSTKINSHKYII